MTPPVGSPFVHALRTASILGEQGASMLAVALALVTGGIPVFPCGVDKAPLVSGGFKGRSSNKAQVRAWWEKFPDALPAVVPGDGGLAALDVDSAESAEAAKGAGVSLTAGFIVATGGTSVPFMFEGQELQPMHVYVVSSVEPQLKGVVVRYNAGYVIAPGARRGAKTYRVIHDGDPAPWGFCAPAARPQVPLPPAELDLKRVEAAVDAIPNTADTDRNQYVAMAHKIKAAAGGAGRQLFLDWAARWPGPVDTAEDERVWDTLPPTTIDAFALFRLAAKYGFIATRELQLGAQVDFADASDRGNAIPSGPAIGAPQHRRLPVKSFAEVTPVAIDWLLPGRLARQQITMINGWPGEGKTSVVIDIVARLSQGRELPDGTRPPRPLRVMYLSTEDSQSVLSLRLRAAGADSSQVLSIPDTDVLALTLPTHQARWIELLLEHQIDVVAIDPMKAVLDPDLKDIAEQDARLFMLALRQICERANVAAICIRHPSKATAAGRMTAIGAASGSLAYTAAARIELLVGRMPDDEETRALASVKNNLAAPPPALLYAIVSRDLALMEGEDATESVAAIDWRGVDTTIQADELLARREGREERTKLEVAKEFLKNILADGPMDHRAVRSEGRKLGITKRTLERARQQLGWTCIVGNLRAGGRQIWGLQGQTPGEFGQGTGTSQGEQEPEPSALSDREGTGAPIAKDSSTAVLGESGSEASGSPEELGGQFATLAT